LLFCALLFDLSCGVKKENSAPVSLERIEERNGALRI
jgi:hypothetical protein